jgi:hypothetical protein
MLLPRVRSLWNTLVHKERLDRELDDELRAHDPVSYGAALGLILCGSALACGIPAWRGTRVSPMDALRTESV